MSNSISIYKKVSDTKSQDVISIDILLDNIKNGQYWEHVKNVRLAKTKDEKSSLKKNVPCVCLSGTFSERSDSKIIDHSGFLCIDIDNYNPDEVKELLSPDPYVYSIFESISGNGAAIIFRIDKKRHRDAFKAISKYLFNDYNLVADPSCINESRARLVSHDPKLYVNHSAKKWTEYLPKEKDAQRESKIVYVRSDFERIISEIASKKLDIAGSYDNWLKVGFAIASKFGEGGRNYFQIISQYRDGQKAANEKLINQQYDACLKSRGSGITIGTFYYFAKLSGIETYSIETKEIIKLSRSNKKSGLDNAATIDNLKEQTAFNHESINEIVPQVDANDIPEDYTLIDCVIEDLKLKYDIRRNVINRNLEFRNGKDYERIDNIHFNSIYLRLKKQYDKLSFDLFERIMLSDETRNYNPFHQFFEQYNHLKPIGNIKRLNECIYSDFGLSGEIREFFLKKWLIGIVSSMNDEHSPLMLVLTGEEQGTGKTQFFRRLLPDELKKYYAESKLDSGKDDEILMTQKILICDDEMGGKSKKEIARLKELTSKQTFSLREPYGRNNVDLNRIAVLCGTSNDNEVLNDPTGNRRVIPIHVKSINHNAYNAINKIDLLMEVYWLWHNGENHELSKSDIDELKKYTAGEFEEISSEQEMIWRYYRLPLSENEGEYYTTSDIMAHIDFMSRVKVTTKRIGMILKKYGLRRSHFLRNNQVAYGYKLVKVDVMHQNESVNDFSQNSSKNDEHIIKNDKLNNFIIFDDLEEDLPF